MSPNAAVNLVSNHALCRMRRSAPAVNITPRQNALAMIACHRNITAAGPLSPGLKHLYGERYDRQDTFERRGVMPEPQKQDPQEVPPTRPGQPQEPPQESPPGNPRPDIPVPVREPDTPSQPQELPPNAPDELPVRGPGSPPFTPPVDPGLIDLPGADPGLPQPPSI